MQAPELVHFFSDATGVSLELPLGFTVLHDDSGGQSCVLVGDEPDDAAPEIVAFVDIRVLAQGDGGSGVGGGGAVGDGAVVGRDGSVGVGLDGSAGRRAATSMVDALAMHAGAELSRDWREIDAEDVLCAALHFPDGLPGVPGPSGGTSTAGAVADFLTGDLLVVVAAALTDGRLVSITASAPFSARETWCGSFDRALTSVRFVPAGWV